MLRPWNLKLELEKDADQAIYLQIAEKIIDEIQTGRLPPTNQHIKWKKHCGR